MNPATAANLKRKAAWADSVQLRDGVPLPSWVDISLTELCGRSHGSPKACTFCPRIDPAFYPNQALHMSIAVAQKIADELRSWDYRGAVVLCGYGEPLLHPKLAEIVACFRGLHLEIVTNGDKLTAKSIAELSAAGCNHFVVSLYDGPEQITKFNALFTEAGCADYTLRDRWHTEADDFGLKLTNRAGATDAGNQPEIDQARGCFYASYHLQLDWNADILLCPQLWDKKLKFGNVAGQSIWEVWTSRAMHKRRMTLLDSRKGLSGCSGCNTDGKAHGANHAAAWRNAG